MNDSLTIDCRHCNDLRVVPHVQLGPIRCPVCTVRAKPRDPEAMARANQEFTEHVRENLSGAEARRITRAIGKLLAHAVFDRFRFKGLPTHLISTDAILQRWAAAPTGLPAENSDVYAQSRPPPLDPRTQEAVSDIIRALPTGIRGFVFNWYKAPGISVNVMAERRKLSRRQLEREWLDCLVFTRTRFLESPHHDLVAITRVLP